MSSISWSRRRALAVLGGLPLAGCGFTPLYGEAGGAAPSGRVGQELAAVRVALIPDRAGQLLRRSLQQKLDPQGGDPPAARYDLRVAVQYNSEAQGFARDGTSSRVRYTAQARWALFSMAAPPVQLASGTERSFDAFNIPTNEFFAADQSRDAMERRLADQLAEEIVRRLALQLQQLQQLPQLQARAAG